MTGLESEQYIGEGIRTPNMHTPLDFDQIDELLMKVNMNTSFLQLASHD